MEKIFFEQVFFGYAFTAYTVAMTLFLGYAFTRRESLSSVARWVLSSAVVAHVVSLIVRTVVARQLPQHGWYVPWSNWFESFSFFTLIIAVEFLIIQWRQHLPILGAFVSPILFTTMMVAINSPFGTQIPTLPPALQSYWMAIHVPVMFIAYSAFANAFAVGMAYLLQERQIKSHRPSHLAFRLPSLDDLDAMIYRVISLAFPILTLGVLLGAMWAYDAWGRYWGWDAKETWALITWIMYAIYLHMRLVMGWRGRKTAYLSLAGFGVVIFTYVGVNYLSELHGFLSGGGR
jgi:cytochrome c-type biogenesis protein CcsB